MGLGRVRVVGQALAPLAVLAAVSGCAEDRAASPGTASATPREVPPPKAEHTPPPCDAECQVQRDERRAEDEKRCAAMVDRVDLTWRITTTPTDRGQEIGLRMIVANRSDARLSGDTWGVMRVEPGRRDNGIRWGGSSSDVLYQQPYTTSEREVWHERRPPGWHPAGEQVTSFRYDAYSYAPGRPVLVCHLPATVEAPPGLVDGHRSGRWTLQPEP